MGTPLPPNAPGLLCPTCWGPAKPFGDGPSPTVIQLRLTDLVEGEFYSPGDDSSFLPTHWLEQTASPCFYRIVQGDFVWIVFWALGQTIVDVNRVSDGRRLFFADPLLLCQLRLQNQIVSAAGNVAHGGFATITWDLQGLD